VKALIISSRTSLILSSKNVQIYANILRNHNLNYLDAACGVLASLFLLASRDFLSHLSDVTYSSFVIWPSGYGLRIIVAEAGRAINTCLGAYPETPLRNGGF
jgi:hypothetical protein